MEYTKTELRAKLSEMGLCMPKKATRKELMEAVQYWNGVTLMAHFHKLIAEQTN